MKDSSTLSSAIIGVSIVIAAIIFSNNISTSIDKLSSSIEQAGKNARPPQVNIPNINYPNLNFPKEFVLKHDLRNSGYQFKIKHSVDNGQDGLKLKHEYNPKKIHINMGGQLKIED